MGMTPGPAAAATQGERSLGAAALGGRAAVAQGSGLDVCVPPSTCGSAHSRGWCWKEGPGEGTGSRQHGISAR